MGGGVGVEGQKAYSIVAGDVRGIDSSVRADEAVARLRDDNAAVHPHDALALAEDDLDLPRILVIAGGEALGKDRRFDGCQVHKAPLGLTNYFMRDHHYVIGLQE